MCQAFSSDLIWPRAGMEMRGSCADQIIELSALWESMRFLDPDLTDQLTLPFGDLLTRPTLPRLLGLI
jgi:hypothetical protein